MAITISGTTLTYNDGSTDTTDTENTTAALGAGAIGSYAQLYYPGNAAARAAGFTIAGSSLLYGATASGITVNAGLGTPPGSWRLMGALPSVTSPVPKGGSVTSYTATSVWLRYA
jgi:hypothetical protein